MCQVSFESVKCESSVCQVCVNCNKRVELVSSVGECVKCVSTVFQVCFEHVDCESSMSCVSSVCQVYVECV